MIVGKAVLELGLSIAQVVNKFCVVVVCEWCWLVGSFCKTNRCGNFHLSKGEYTVQGLFNFYRKRSERNSKESNLKVILSYRASPRSENWC